MPLARGNDKLFCIGSRVIYQTPSPYPLAYVEAGAPVVVLDAGRVLEHGTAAELRVRRGAFSRLELRH